MLSYREQERRKQDIFFEVSNLEKPPELAPPEESEEEVEALLGIVGAIVGGVVGGVATGATGLALIASIAQGIATGYAIGSMVEGLFASPSDDAPEPEKLPDPTYSFNTAGNQGVAKRGETIPLVYTSKSLNSQGGVRYLGKLIFSQLENHQNRGRLRQLYALGHQQIRGNKQKSFYDTMLVNDRKANEIFLQGEDDEISIRFVPDNNQISLNPPFKKKYSQSINPTDFQKFGYKFVHQVDTENQSVNSSTIYLPGATSVYGKTVQEPANDGEINKFQIYQINKKRPYALCSRNGNQQFKIQEVNFDNWDLKANRSLSFQDREKILEINKFKYATTKIVNETFFNIDYTLFAKDLQPQGEPRRSEEHTDDISGKF